jgi:hypothetical protein
LFRLNTFLDSIVFSVCLGLFRVKIHLVLNIFDCFLSLFFFNQHLHFDCPDFGLGLCFNLILASLSIGLQLRDLLLLGSNHELCSLSFNLLVVVHQVLGDLRFCHSDGDYLDSRGPFVTISLQSEHQGFV